MRRLGVSALVLVLCACNQVSRISECKRFVSLANPTLREIEEVDARNQIVPESATYEHLALRFDRFVAEIEALKLKDKELNKAVGPIKNTMKSAAEDCRSYARELREHQKKEGDSQKAAQLALRRKLKKTRTRVSLNLKQYKSLVARVDGVCQPQ